MHEMALGRGLVQLLEEQAQAQGFARVRKVTLALGDLGHVDPESLAFCFDVVTKGTVAEGAVLDIRRPAGQAHCWDCGIAVTIQSRADACPSCGGHRLSVIAGDEMTVRELEVD
ncbi:MAG: hydrogenase maturation nickel metallochaperone HypA [Pseudomonadota bacterium]